MSFIFFLIEHVRLQIDISIDWYSLWPIYSTFPFIGLIIYMIAHPEKIEKWHGLFARLLSFISKRAERQSVSSDIQARLYSFIKSFHLDDVLPYKIRFKWITGSNFESYVNEGEVIIIMDNHKNNARNFVNAIVAYTTQAFLPSVR